MEKRFVFGRPSGLALAALACAAWWALAIGLGAGFWIAMLPLIALAAWRMQSPFYFAATAISLIPFVLAFEWAFAPLERLRYYFAPNPWDDVRFVALWVGLGFCLAAFAWYFRLGPPIRIGRMLARRFRGAPCGTCARNAVEDTCLHEEARLRNRLDWLILMQRAILLAGCLGFALNALSVFRHLVKCRGGCCPCDLMDIPLEAVGPLGMALPAVIVLQAAIHYLRVKGQQRLAYARSLASVLIDDAAEGMRAKGLLTARCCAQG